MTFQCSEILEERRKEVKDERKTIFINVPKEDLSKVSKMFSDIAGHEYFFILLPLEYKLLSKKELKKKTKKKATTRKKKAPA